MDSIDSWLFNSFWGQASLLGILLAMVVFGVWAILTERLFGRTTVTRIVKEREDWKAAYFTEAKAHAITQQSLKSATDSLQVTDSVLKHLREVRGVKND